MTPPARSPDWRDEAASGLLLRHLEIARPAGPILLMGSVQSDVRKALEGMGCEVVWWTRRAFGGRRATPWPPMGPFNLVALRLPRAKDELDMSLHGAAGSLAPGGGVLVYGAKDEGIGSVPRRLEPLFDRIEAVEVGGHCRVFRGRLREAGARPRVGLHAWRTTIRIEHGPLVRDWVSFPGIFAHGHLDPGTRLLLDALPNPPEEAGILDYGCGSGVVGAMMKELYPQVRLEFLDVDSVALEAVRENLPGARPLLVDGLPPPGREGLFAIVSNPPFHRGKAEEPEMVLELIRGAPALLEPGGGLVFVSQKRLRVEATLKRCFRRVSVRAEGKGFRIWEGWVPR